jgi:hypothetical protein
MLVQIIPRYILWHYTLGFRSAATFGGNLVRFLFNFFSIALLLKTLFAPWRRLGEGYAKGLRPGAWFETLVVNTLMRLVGAIIRLGLIVAGLAALVAGLVLAVVILIVWLLLPIIWVGLLVGGLFLIVS